nr:Sm2=nuclease [Serratia marcescens, Peptide Partial, 11 aa] [Serratia marcescens]
DTLESIDNCAV